jgi:hypothetical protein
VPADLQSHLGAIVFPEAAWKMSTNTPPLVVRVDGNSGSAKDPALLQPVDVDFDDASAKSPVLSDLHGASLPHTLFVTG